MKRALTLPLLSLVLTAGCSNQKLLPADTSHFTVDSQPRGATVYVMGQALGTTPVQVMRKQIFPVTYPASLQAEYGTLTIESPGCDSYRVPVSNRILEDGLVAKLDCDAAVPAAISNAPQTATSAPTGDNAKHRLLQLKQLFDEELISEEEYRAKRKAIIDAL